MEEKTRRTGIRVGGMHADAEGGTCRPIYITARETGDRRHETAAVHHTTAAAQVSPATARLASFSVYKVVHSAKWHTRHRHSSTGSADRIGSTGSTGSARHGTRSSRRWGMRIQPGFVAPE